MVFHRNTGFPFFVPFPSRPTVRTLEFCQHREHGGLPEISFSKPRFFVAEGRSVIFNILPECFLEAS